MDANEKLIERKAQITKQIAELGPMRRGSIVEQFVETVDKKGNKARRGPYTLYSFKEKGKTVSRRMGKGHDVEIYRQQIEAFREYQRLSAELVDISQQLADLRATGKERVKKTPGK